MKATADREWTDRRARRKEQTRARLLDVAVRLFAEQGYDQTSVEQIAETADVARQTFFNYFPGKEDVVHAWVEHRRAEVRAGLTAASDGDAPARLRNGLLAVARLYDRDADTSRPMVRHWVRTGGPLLPGADATADLLHTVIAEGQAAGQLHADIDPQVAAHLLLDAYLGALYRWAAGDGELQQQLQPQLEVVLAALGARR